MAHAPRHSRCECRLTSYPLPRSLAGLRKKSHQGVRGGLRRQSTKLRLGRTKIAPLTELVDGTAAAAHGEVPASGSACVGAGLDIPGDTFKEVGPREFLESPVQYVAKYKIIVC